MSHVTRGPVVFGALLIAAIGVVVGVVAYTVHQRESRQEAKAISPTTAPAPISSVSSTAVVKKPPKVDAATPPATFIDVVRAESPTFPTTQPLAVPLELNQAARLVIHAPIYLCRSSGDLWITLPNAAPTAKVLKNAAEGDAADPQTHVLRDNVVFVHWSAAPSGNIVPTLICRGNDGSFEAVTEDRRFAVPPQQGYRWDRAFSWNDRVVVPTASGISVLQLRPQIREWHRELLAGATTRPTTRPSESAVAQALPDGQGLLAWAPWERGGVGSRGAARFIDDKWVELGPDQGWPERIAYLVPLRDGTVFQFVTHENDGISVETAPLDSSTVDEHAIEKLVTDLSDADPDVRRKAVSELANFGPGAWPVLARLSADQPPQAKLLLRQLLKDKNRPTLSGMTLLGDRVLRLASRLSDGGAVFYVPQGISIPDADGEPAVTAPAWLSVRPGHYIELLSEILTADLKPDECHLDVVGDQWVATTDIRGPRLFYGNGFATLLRKDERDFTQVVGADQRGRWLFRKASADAASGAATPTLVLDPHLPDPTPRLPVWNLAIAETVGWDKDNWPVVQNGAAYALNETDWRPLDKDEKFSTSASEVPPTTLPASGPSTAPASGPAAGRTPILIAPDGSKYYGGLTNLEVILPDGTRTDWPLPPIANGTGPVTLLRTKPGKLFLFNQPGRLLRIAPTPLGPEPFKLEATFTKNIPSIAKPTRIWMDPAGRIDIAWENRLAILFPEGFLPRAISEKMMDQGADADSN